MQRYIVPLSADIRRHIANEGDYDSVKQPSFSTMWCAYSFNDQFVFFVLSACSLRSYAVWYGKHFMWNVGHSTSILAPWTHKHRATFHWATPSQTTIIIIIPKPMVEFMFQL